MGQLEPSRSRAHFEAVVRRATRAAYGTRVPGAIALRAASMPTASIPQAAALPPAPPAAGCILWALQGAMREQLMSRPLRVHAQTKLQVEPPSEAENFAALLDRALQDIAPLHGESIISARATTPRAGTVEATLVFDHWDEEVSGQVVDEQFASDILDTAMRIANEAQRTHAHALQAAAPAKSDVNTQHLGSLFVGV